MRHLVENLLLTVFILIIAVLSIFDKYYILTFFLVCAEISLIIHIYSLKKKIKSAERLYSKVRNQYNSRRNKYNELMIDYFDLINADAFKQDEEGILNIEKQIKSDIKKMRRYKMIYLLSNQERRFLKTVELEIT